MEKVGAYGLQVEALTSVYQALARCIVYQQLTAKAAATIYARLTALGAQGLPTPTEVLQMNDSTLRGVGLSGAKTRALKDLAQRQEHGLLPSVIEASGLSDDTLIERLTTVRGIGPWSVQMLLMFRLGRRDVWPTTDYGVQKAYQKVFRKKSLPTPRELLLLGERFRPQRTMAAWYLWRALDG